MTRGGFDAPMSHGSWEHAGHSNPASVKVPPSNVYLLVYFALGKQKRMIWKLISILQKKKRKNKNNSVLAKRYKSFFQIAGCLLVLHY